MKTTEMTSLVEIDGSMGEGGGQILRSALSLSIITGRPFVMDRIRAKREKPGLMRQHLTCVKAAEEISAAQVSGAELGSQSLTFIPGELRSGTYSWAIGSAGSCNLVLQTVLVPLMGAGCSSQIQLRGGTHNSMSPSSDFLVQSFLPAIHAMGFNSQLTCIRHGFYPAGGGLLEVSIEPTDVSKAAIEWSSREIFGMEALALSANIPSRIGNAELELLGARLGISSENCQARMVSSDGPGNLVMVTVMTNYGKRVFTSYGERRLSLEKVVENCAEQVEAWLGSGASVDEYLQDQLLLPLAIGGGGRFTSTRPSLHTETNLEVIAAFLPVTWTLTQLAEKCWQIEIVPRGTC